MVSKLKCPVVDDNYIDEVVVERSKGVNKSFFDRIRLVWKARARLYEIYKGDPEILKSWLNDEAEKGALNNLYNNHSNASRHGSAIRSIREHDMQLCPACGELGTPNTLDHYLPKDIYPEFSIFPLNLFPMCDICQIKKGKKTTSTSNRRLFIHPYYADFIEKQVVFLNISGDFKNPVAELVLDSGLSADERRLLGSHVTELEIDSRFIKFFSVEYIRLLRVVNKIRSTGLDVRSSLAIFEASALLKGCNCWEHIFYHGVTKNESLMEYLCGGELPEYL